MRGSWVLLLVLLAGCETAVAPPQTAVLPPPAPPRPTAYEQCQAALDEFGFDVKLVPAFATEEGCGIRDGVRLPTEIGFNAPAQLSCELAVAFANFEYGTVQPLARRFLGQAVTRIHHSGTYSCRHVRGRTSWRGLSEHAHGKAIDVVAFDLADGSRVSVDKDWGAPGPRREFLHALARGACETFDVVLSPEYDRIHHDHLHLDVGGRKFCK